MNKKTPNHRALDREKPQQDLVRTLASIGERKKKLWKCTVKYEHELNLTQPTSEFRS